MRYGLFELNTIHPKGNNMAETKVCPPQVLALVEHLRSTGTGQAKLDKITELGKLTNSLDEFLSMLPANVPPQTLTKVDEYIGKTITEKEEKATGKKGPEAWLTTERGKGLLNRHKEAAAKAEGKGATVTQTRDQNQSSIPELTVITESKSPVLKPEGSNQAKQLGADVEVPADSVPGNEGSEDESEGAEAEKSEVADKNVEEAKDAISRMRSKPKLQGIAAHDTRKTVKEAAELRLMELEEAEKE